MTELFPQVKSAGTIKHPNKLPEDHAQAALPLAKGGYLAFGYDKNKAPALHIRNNEMKLLFEVSLSQAKITAFIMIIIHIDGMTSEEMTKAMSEENLKRFSGAVFNDTCVRKIIEFVEDTIPDEALNRKIELCLITKRYGFDKAREVAKLDFEEYFAYFEQHLKPLLIVAYDDSEKEQIENQLKLVTKGKS